MFEDLKQHITTANLRQVAARHRYGLAEGGEQEERDSDRGSSVDEHSLSDYQLDDDGSGLPGPPNDLPGQPSPPRYFSPQSNKTHEIELLAEKIRVLEDCHAKQLQYIEDSHQRQLQALSLELHNARHSLSTHSSQQQTITLLRGQLRQAVEAQDSAHALLDAKLRQLQELALSNQILTAEIKQQAQPCPEQSTLAFRLKQAQIDLQNSQIAARDKQGQLELALAQSRRDNEALKQSLHSSELAFAERMSQATGDLRAGLQRLQDEHATLSRRNAFLEDSLLQHIGSLLQRGNPCQSSSKVHQQTALTVQDPQKTTYVKDKVSSLRQKLAQANAKIVELLKWKCTHSQAWPDCL